MKTEKNVKKLGNLLIREPSAKRKQPPIQKRGSMTGDIKPKRLDVKLQINREMIQAQNLNEQQLKAISRQASRMMNRKVKEMETKVSGGLVEMLESQCQKLGIDLEKERADNFALSNQNIQLRRNVQILNRKLSEHNKQNNQLIQENDNADIKVEQAKDEIQRVKLIMRKREEQFTTKLSTADLRYEKLSKELQSNKIQLEEKVGEIQTLKTEVEQLIEQLEHYRGEGQKLKQNSDHRLKQFNKLRQQMQVKHKQELEKKNQKIIRFQLQAQQLEEKLKQQQSIRKKMAEKSKQLEKQLSKKTENIHNLSSQVAMSKKRINDLNILKSSNKTILDEKITKLLDENQKLKRQVLSLKKNSKNSPQEEDVSCKPQMFDDQ